MATGATIHTAHGLSTRVRKRAAAPQVAGVGAGAQEVAQAGRGKCPMH